MGCNCGGARKAAQQARAAQAAKAAEQKAAPGSGVIWQRKGKS